MTKIRHSRLDCNPGCSVEATISLIDGKWKCVLSQILSMRWLQKYTRCSLSQLQSSIEQNSLNPAHGDFIPH